MIPIQREYRLIPENLLLAANNFEGFKIVHLEYWTKYGGNYGFCTYRMAFEFLVSDLEDHNLPVNYTSYNSFCALKSRTARKS